MLMLISLMLMPTANRSSVMFETMEGVVVWRVTVWRLWCVAVGRQQVAGRGAAAAGLPPSPRYRVVNHCFFMAYGLLRLIALALG
jgi:hypothetical protein